MTVCAIVNLAPACVDITGVRAGDRNLVTATVVNHGAPMNLTGLTPLSQVRKKATDTGLPALIADVQIIDAATGRISLRWDGDAVATLLGGAAKWSGVWDLQFAASGEDPITYAAGKWSAETDVSRT